MNPNIVIWLGTAFFVVFSVLLLMDVVLVSVFWDKLRDLARQNLSIVPWFVKDVIRVAFGLVLLFLVISLAGSFILKINPEIRGQLKPIVNIIAGICMYGGGIWLILRFLKINYQLGPKALGIIPKRWFKGSLKAILFYAGFVPALFLLTYIGLLFCNYLGIKPEPHPLVDILKKEKSYLFIFYLLFVATLVAPIFEEILFRGLFYQSLKKSVGFPKAALLSSCLFSLVHFNAVQFLPIMGLGMLLCWVFENTGSLIPSIVLHIFNNGVFLGLFFLMKEYI